MWIYFLNGMGQSRLKSEAQTTIWVSLMCQGTHSWYHPLLLSRYVIKDLNRKNFRTQASALTQDAPSDGLTGCVSSLFLHKHLKCRPICFQTEGKGKIHLSALGEKGQDGKGPEGSFQYMTVIVASGIYSSDVHHMIGSFNMEKVS